MSNKYQAALLALIAFGLLIAPLPARAGTNLGMQLSSTPTTFTICDNNIDFVGCIHNDNDLDPTLGSILFDGSVAAWSLTTTNGTGPPVLTSPNLLSLSTASASSSAGAAPITFLLTVTGVTAPTGNVTFLTNTAGSSGLSSTTVTVQTWLSAANTAFCFSANCGILVSSDTYSGLTWGTPVSGTIPTGGGPYAVTLLVTINTQGLADTITFAPTVNVLLPCAVCGHRSALPAADGRPEAAAARLEWAKQESLLHPEPRGI
jgi:hypothetical protein